MDKEDSPFEKLLEFLIKASTLLFSLLEETCHFILDISTKVLWGTLFLSAFYAFSSFKSGCPPTSVKNLLLIPWLCILSSQFGECALGNKKIKNMTFSISIAILLFFLPVKALTNILIKNF